MRERPILFSGEMVRAILDGRKSMTRRVVSPQPPSWCDRAGVSALTPVGRWEFRGTHPELGASCAFIKCPYLPASETRLWVITIRDIPGHEGRYGAGDDGGIYRTDGPEPNRLREAIVSGYCRVSLALGKRGSQENRFVHEAVCSAFYGQRPSNRHEVRHLDGDRRNNLPDNLDWGTPEENWSDRKCHGRGIHETHHNAKLSMEIATAMRASGKTAWALSKQYGVSPKTVANVLNGRTWIASKPSPRHMPRWASRITLAITSIRVERLQAVSEEDAAAEGIDDAWLVRAHTGNSREVYRDLWDSLAKPEHRWDVNPWVWAISFRRIST